MTTERIPRFYSQKVERINPALNQRYVLMDAVDACVATRQYFEDERMVVENAYNITYGTAPWRYNDD
jgi:hypothetical protein